MAYPLEEELGRTCGFFLWLASAPGPNWQVALEADRQVIPVVFMTGDAGQAEELVEGGRPYLLKPFAIATLIDVVENRLRHI